MILRRESLPESRFPFCDDEAGETPAPPSLLGVGRLARQLKQPKYPPPGVSASSAKSAVFSRYTGGRAATDRRCVRVYLAWLYVPQALVLAEGIRMNRGFRRLRG